MMPVKYRIFFISGDVTPSVETSLWGITRCKTKEREPIDPHISQTGAGAPAWSRLFTVGTPKAGHRPALHRVSVLIGMRKFTVKT